MLIVLRAFYTPAFKRGFIIFGRSERIHIQM